MINHHTMTCYNGTFGSVLSVGVRTTRIRFFGQVTIVRNNDFKNYITMDAEKEARVLVNLCVDLREDLERVEKIIEREFPHMHDEVREFSWDPDLKGPVYRGVSEINQNGYVLNFAVLVKNTHYGWALRGMNRELKLMCERNNIRLAMPQIVVNEPVPERKRIDAAEDQMDRH